MPDIKNRAGATVYEDIKKHKVLDVPKVPTTSHQGRIYRVLSVGMHKSGIGMVTIKEKNRAIAYQLPKGRLQEWAVYSIGMAQQGLKSFPCDIEFGELPTGHYAEML